MLKKYLVLIVKLWNASSFCFRSENGFIYIRRFLSALWLSVKNNLEQAGLFLNFNCPGKITSFVFVFFNELYTFCFHSVLNVHSCPEHLKHTCLDHVLDISLIFRLVSLCLMLLFAFHKIDTWSFVLHWILFLCPYFEGVGRKDKTCYVYRTTMKIFQSEIEVNRHPMRPIVFLVKILNCMSDLSPIYFF